MNKKLITTTLLLMLCITLFIPLTTVVYASSSNNNITDALNRVKSATGTTDMNDAKEDIANLGKDGIDILITVIWYGIIGSGFIIAFRLATAGDDASKKSKLKIALALHIIGIIFLANYYGFLDFAFNKIKIFK